MSNCNKPPERKSVGTVSVKMCCGTTVVLFTPTTNYLYEDRGKKYTLFVAEGEGDRRALLKELKHDGVRLQLCIAVEQCMSALILAATKAMNVEVSVVGNDELRLKCVTIPAPTKS